MTQDYRIQLSMNQSHIVDSGLVFKQGDFGFTVTIEVLDFDTTGATAKIIWRKSQGAVEGNSFTRVGNTFTYTMQGTELDVPGMGICDLKLYDSTTKRLSTASFKYLVEADTMDGFEEEAHSYSDTIAQIAEQIQGYADESEAWAIGTKQGVPVTSDDPQYENFAKWYVEFAEAWANGEKDGTPVTSGDPAYENNAKYYVQFAEAWAKGTKDGTPVSSGDPQYDNNSKYFSNSSEAWAVGQIDGVDVDSGDARYQNNSKWYSGVSQFYAGEAHDEAVEAQNIYDELVGMMGLGTFTYDAATGNLYYDVSGGSAYSFSLTNGNLYVDVVTP